MNSLWSFCTHLGRNNFTQHFQRREKQGTIHSSPYGVIIVITLEFKKDIMKKKNYRQFIA